MKKTWKRWTQIEDTLLREKWATARKDDLMTSFPERTYASLMLRAGALGIKAKIHRKRIGTFDKLNQLNPTSAYWWGFIMADGHLSKRGELVVSLHIRDSDHLEQLGKLLECSVRTNGSSPNMCHLSLQDRVSGKDWLKRLKIEGQKTYNPPDLSMFLTQELLMDFFIGFSDGDGCIWVSKNWPNLRIEVHGNWLLTLQLLSDKLKEFFGIACKVRTTKKGTAMLTINTKKDLLILSNYSKSIYCLKRKWDRLSHLKSQ